MAEEDKDLVAQLQAAERADIERQRDPYSYSSLPSWLELETWDAESALCLLAGIDPKGAKILDSYEKVLGVTIHEPKLVNAQLLTEGDLFYLIPWEAPSSEDEAMSATELAEVKVKQKKLKEAERVYRRMVRLWRSDPDNALAPHKRPSEYLEWADRKGVQVHWRDWYLVRGFKLAADAVAAEHTGPQDVAGLTLGSRAETA